MVRKALNILVNQSTKLATFSIIGQGLGVLSFIVAANWFGQEAVGLYSVFLSICAIISSISILSLEKNIPNVAEDEACEYLIGSIMVLLIAVILSLLFLRLFNYQFYNVAALYILVLGFSRIADTTNIRNKSFHLIMASKIVPSTIFLLLLLTAVGAESESIGWLVMSQTISMMLFTIWYVWKSYQAYEFKNFSIKKSIDLIKAEWRFMVFVSPSEVLNRMALHIPTIMIERFFGSLVAAQYALVLRICLSPISIVCSAVGQVFQGDLAYLARNNRTKTASKKFNSLSVKLAVLGGIFTIFLFTLGPYFIDVFFGAGWDLSQSFVKILSPLVFLMIIVTPLSTALYVFKRHVFLFISQLLFFLLSFFSYLAGIVMEDILIGVWLFTILSSIRYLYIFRKIRAAAQY